MMKKFFCCCLMIFAMVALTPYAFADTVVGSSSTPTRHYGWQTWTGPDEDGKPYWDHISSDGVKSNVGYYLTNSGAFSNSKGAAGPGAIPFWGNTYNTVSDTHGEADPKFYFTGGTERSAALKMEVAGWKDSNVFGWYDVNKPETLNVIFDGSKGTGASITFTPSAEYGFYFSTTDGIFRTQSSLNTDTKGTGKYTNEQHFAVFNDGTSYWLGMEDTKFSGSGSDKDYNDMIVHVSHAPLPGALLLFAPGLVGLALVRRRFTR